LRAAECGRVTNGSTAGGLELTYCGAAGAAAVATLPATRRGVRQAPPAGSGRTLDVVDRDI